MFAIPIECSCPAFSFPVVGLCLIKLKNWKRDHAVYCSGFRVRRHRKVTNFLNVCHLCCRILFKIRFHLIDIWSWDSLKRQTAFNWSSYFLIASSNFAILATLRMRRFRSFFFTRLSRDLGGQEFFFLSALSFFDWHPSIVTLPSGRVISKMIFF